MTPAAIDAIAHVEWAGPSVYVTARGKSKDIVTGDALAGSLAQAFPNLSGDCCGYGRAMGSRHSLVSQPQPRITMIVLQYLAAGLCALAAVLAGVVFVLSFVSWLMCEPAARRGVFRPRPLFALAAWAFFATATCLLIP